MQHYAMVAPRPFRQLRPHVRKKLLRSTLIETMALQDLGCGNGFALIDPHGDLVARIAARIPAAQRDRVIYLNTTDRAQPYGYNPLRHVTEESRISDGTDASGSGCVGTPLTGVKRHGQRRAEEAR
jgi:hypothetical protein